MEEVKYAGLRKVSDALRTLAWVVLILCGIGLLVGLGLIVRKPEASGILCLASLIYGVFGFLYLYGMSQLILVVLDIEANTRVTALKQ
ncbi:MAG: hypothetical protein NTY10_07140 [Candidatus Omnitrophica bacterium]|nr:hypothetical protein [Candidatus Omnitrophota bacterium]